MIVTHSITEVRQKRWSNPAATWGFVPTMGYLHAGHLSLVQRAKQENDQVAVSIYVNPTQFAPHEDLATYPRDLERDLALLQAAGVDLVFTPNDQVMYPAGFQTKVEVTQLAQYLEGASRPTHFAGVTLVVSKLFNIVQPTRAYFGQKDAQQTIVLRRMVQDLNVNLELIVCPTGREADGLAMSSRNKYLSAEQRQAAPVLYQALQQAQTLILQGERQGETIKQAILHHLSQEPLARPDYVSVASAETLQELTELSGSILISLAVFFGKTRLIDNLMLELV